MARKREQNSIEQIFYDAFAKRWGSDPQMMRRLEPQAVIPPYKVDFLFCKKIIVEIDGHEYHKTKEQRQKDYERERYFIKQGYIVIRYTGSEVYLQPENCIEDFMDVFIGFSKVQKAFWQGDKNA